MAGEADYCSDFGGTSYSSPVVAGIAALILSARPTLSWVEVREILRTTSRKVNIGEKDPFGLWQDLPPMMAPENDRAERRDERRAAQVAERQHHLDGGGDLLPAKARRHLNHGQSTLQLASAAGFEIGDAIHITNGDRSDFHVIEGKSGNTITIDALHFSFDTTPTTHVTAGRVKPVRSDYYGHGRVNGRRAVRAAIDYDHADRDLAIRNHLGDDGLANVDSAANPIHSPDIWLRNQNDPALPAPPYDRPGPHPEPAHRQQPASSTRGSRTSAGGSPTSTPGCISTSR